MFIDHDRGTINCKIVYWGPSLSGRTTNMQFIYSSLDEARRGKMISLATETERALFFDFEVERVQIAGLALRLHLYTVPGASVYEKSRKMLLKGVEAIVCVWDSQPERIDANRENAENLGYFLGQWGYRPEEVITVHQYNKRDLPGITDLKALDDEFNPRRLPSFPAVAVQGEGVRETLDAVTRLIVERLRHQVVR